MKLNFRKLFVLQNYTSKYRKIRRNILIIFLSRSNNSASEIFPIWQVNKKVFFPDKKDSGVNSFFVFGNPIKFSEIDWHKDTFSSYKYPLVISNKLNFIGLFNTGIDIVFPWEQSRFYFVSGLAIIYKQSKEKKYYNLVKVTILDWINKNPFLHGVNWISTMDVAIRSVNWIVGLNLFEDLFYEDSHFRERLSNSLVQHANFISYFPAIYDKNHTTNHTTSAYTGLLFLALTLKNHPDSNKWLNQATNGLVQCMNYQVYEDGADFEGSILYHRLVLELFAYSAIVCMANGVHLPDQYFRKLYCMFLFTQAYVDSNGNAPQIGDNDSGRLLVINELDNLNFYLNELNHSYLIDLKDIIFEDYRKSETKDKKPFQYFIPEIKPVQLDRIGIRETQINNSRFLNGGAYLLKNYSYSLMVGCFPIGQNGRGGHNHLDSGSYTLSILGKQIIVDPGSPVYSANKTQRDIFRSYSYHNTLYTPLDNDINWDENGYWGLKKYYDTILKCADENTIQIEIKFLNDLKIRHRKFTLNQFITIQDSYDGQFYSRVNLHPDVEIIKSERFSIITNYCIIRLNGCINYTIKQYNYSPHYGKMVKAKYLNILAHNNLCIHIEGKE